MNYLPSRVSAIKDPSPRRQPLSHQDRGCLCLIIRLINFFSGEIWTWSCRWKYLLPQSPIYSPPTEATISLPKPSLTYSQRHFPIINLNLELKLQSNSWQGLNLGCFQLLLLFPFQLKFPTVINLLGETTARAKSYPSPSVFNGTSVYQTDVLSDLSIFQNAVSSFIWNSLWGFTF